MISACDSILLGAIGNVVGRPVNGEFRLLSQFFVGPERATAPFSKHSWDSLWPTTTSSSNHVADHSREHCTGRIQPRDTASSTAAWLMFSMSARGAPFQTRFVCQCTDLGLQALLVSCKARRRKHNRRGLGQRGGNAEDSCRQRRECHSGLPGRARRGTFLMLTALTAARHGR